MYLSYLLWGIKCITMLVIKMRVIKWGKGSLFVYVFKKYRFLLKNTGLWASKYRFVFPEVGMSDIDVFKLITHSTFWLSFVQCEKNLLNSLNKRWKLIYKGDNFDNFINLLWLSLCPRIMIWNQHALYALFKITIRSVFGWHDLIFI